MDPYFSYEAAFVLWSLFSELDIDGDKLLTLNELRKYGDVSLTYSYNDVMIHSELTLSLILKRRGFYSSQLQEYVIDYKEFVNLVIADESRRCKVSALYWFSIIDLDFTGLVDESCIYCFYKSQVLHK